MMSKTLTRHAPLAAMLWLLAVPALASDQADYSAPYITFENGQLVTKDPTQESSPGTPLHGAAAAPPSAAAGPVTGNAPDSSAEDQNELLGSVAVPLVALTALTVVGLGYYRARNRQQRAPASESV